MRAGKAKPQKMGPKIDRFLGESIGLDKNRRTINKALLVVPPRFQSIQAVPLGQGSYYRRPNENTNIRERNVSSGLSVVASRRERGGGRVTCQMKNRRRAGNMIH